MKKLLADYNINELQTLLGNEPKFRATQLFKWVQNGADFEQMSNIPSELRDKLKKDYLSNALTIERELTSSTDGTAKFLYKLQDGHIIEGVLMRHSYGNTLCVSTQVGCRMRCAFCASGIDGSARDLSAGEILSQVIIINKQLGGTITDRKITNIVLMGSGEPLDNYDNTLKFLRLVNDQNGLGISQRNISLSTCGLADKIMQLADDGAGVTLTVSLHSAIQSEREKIMPIARKFSLNDLRKAAKYYFDKTGRRVIFEYTLIKNSNMRDIDISHLTEFVKGFPTHINLIMLNEVKESGLKPCTRAEAQKFLEDLTAAGVSATIRRSMGADIEGACGQLRNKFVGDK